jgi:hypothetical protein
METEVQDCNECTGVLESWKVLSSKMEPSNQEFSVSKLYHNDDTYKC